MRKRIKLIVVLFALLATVTGAYLVVMAYAPTAQESGAAQIRRIDGTRSSVPEASLELDGASSGLAPEMPPTVDSVTGPDFHTS